MVALNVEAFRKYAAKITVSLSKPLIPLRRCWRLLTPVGSAAALVSHSVQSDLRSSWSLCCWTKVFMHETGAFFKAKNSSSHPLCVYQEGADTSYKWRRLLSAGEHFARALSTSIRRDCPQQSSKLASSLLETGLIITDLCFYSGELLAFRYLKEF